jgi:hypothetical protein
MSVSLHAGGQLVHANAVPPYAHPFQHEASLGYTVRSSQAPFDTRVRMAHRVGGGFAFTNFLYILHGHTLQTSCFPHPYAQPLIVTLQT